MMPHRVMQKRLSTGWKKCSRQRRKIAPGSVKTPGKAGIYQPILAH
jgi:hypothetical protein